MVLLNPVKLLGAMADKFTFLFQMFYMDSTLFINMKFDLFTLSFDPLNLTK